MSHYLHPASRRGEHNKNQPSPSEPSMSHYPPANRRGLHDESPNANKTRPIPYFTFPRLNLSRRNVIILPDHYI